MAVRRMMSRRVTDSTRFLKMPLTSQALYFHLVQHADDDGVVEAYPVIRSTGANEDDLKILVGKGFAIVLNEDFVTYLPDWLEHNSVRADRKVDSIYKDLLIQIVPNVEMKQPKPSYYSTKKVIDGQVTDKCPTNDGQMSDKCPHRLGKDRLGKDRLGKDSIDIGVCAQAELDDTQTHTKKKKTTRFVPPTVEEVKQYCEENNYKLDAQRFVDFYESKGWMIGKNKMKSWQAAVRTWTRKAKEGAKQDEEDRGESTSVRLW